MAEAVDKELEQDNEDGGNFFAGLIVGLFVTFAILGMIAFFSPEKTKAEKAADSYKEAVEFCGEGNVHQNDYTNGSTDFTCRNYARLFETTISTAK